MDVFLGCNRLDAAHAVALNKWLAGQGISTFFGSARSWDRSIAADRSGARHHEAQAVAVLMGPNGTDHAQQYEYQLR